MYYDYWLQIEGFNGRAMIVVSCVTKDAPFFPHPHNLVGRENCEDGICKVKAEINESTVLKFRHLGIQCVKRVDVVKSLEIREKNQVDPFGSKLIYVSRIVFISNL